MTTTAFADLIGPTTLLPTNLLELLMKSIFEYVQREQALVQHVPEKVLAELVEDQLHGLRRSGFLTPEEVDLLLTDLRADSDDTRDAPPPFVSQDGSPSLCGFLSGAVRPRSGLVRTDLVIPGKVLIYAGAAGLGGSMYGGMGAIVGVSIAHALLQ